MTTNLNDIVGDAEFKQQLKDGLSQLPRPGLRRPRDHGGAQGAVGSADENLKNLQGLTGPLGDRGTAIVATLEQSVRNLEELLGQVALLTRNVNNSEGTIGLLIRDRAAVRPAQRDASRRRNGDDLRRPRHRRRPAKFSRRIKQILDNVWVFTDKIARDPARLARGIVDRETPIK